MEENKKRKYNEDNSEEEIIFSNEVEINESNQVKQPTYKTTYTIKDLGSELKFLEKLYSYVSSISEEDIMWSESGKFIITLNKKRYCKKFCMEDFNKYFKRVRISSSYKSSLEKSFCKDNSYKIRCFSNPFFIKDKPHLLKYIGNNFSKNIKIKNLKDKDKEFVDFDKFSENCTAIAKPIQLSLENFNNPTEIKDSVKNIIPDFDFDKPISNQLVYFDPRKSGNLENLPSHLLNKFKNIVKKKDE